jgi:hypothetical protein
MDIMEHHTDSAEAPRIFKLIRQDIERLAALEFVA